MKTKRVSLAAGLALVVLGFCAPCVWSQSYQVIYNFGSPLVGSNPYAGVTLDGRGNLYGTASGGGYHNNPQCVGGCGTVFELSPNEHGGWTGRAVHFFGNDGGNPNAPVVFDRQGNLYGTSNCVFDCFGIPGGVVFKLAPAPSGLWPESVLYAFPFVTQCASRTLNPECSIAFDPQRGLFGATLVGDGCSGTVFQLQQRSFSRWDHLVIYCFVDIGHGEYPVGLLTFDATGNIYGSTSEGGSGGIGTVYRLTLNQGSQDWTETVLYSFQGGNSDGGYPQAGVVLDAAGNIYGTTSQGGSAGMGTVFLLTPQPDGSYLETVLYSFQGGNDAAGPNSSLAFDAAGNLYGTAGGGSFGRGTLFKLTPSGGGH